MLFNPSEREKAFKQALNDDFISEVFFQCEVSSMDQVATLQIALILLLEKYQQVAAEQLNARLNGIPGQRGVYFELPPWMLEKKFMIFHTPAGEMPAGGFPFEVRFPRPGETRLDMQPIESTRDVWARQKTLREAVELARDNFPRP